MKKKMGSLQIYLKTYPFFLKKRNKEAHEYIAKGRDKFLYFCAGLLNKYIVVKISCFNKKYL